MTTVGEFEVTRASRARAGFSRAIVAMLLWAAIGVGQDPFGWPSGLFVWTNLAVSVTCIGLLVRGSGVDVRVLGALFALGALIVEVAGAARGLHGGSMAWAPVVAVLLVSWLVTWRGGVDARYRAY